MTKTLLSVGIDIGTSTTQMVISRLQLVNRASPYTVPQIDIAEKQVLYRSPIRFTPLLSDTTIDALAIRDMVQEQYAAAGVAPERIDTGAVIITGETARKENARQVLEALSAFAGDFVVATAGPTLESVLAGKGAGAAAVSREKACPVLNLDIGGGTTNLALFDQGQTVDTGCLNVGGRLVKYDPAHKITYISPVLAGVTDLRVGQMVGEADLQPLAKLLAQVLCQALALAPNTGLPERFVTDKLLPLNGQRPLLTFSGGVADLLQTTQAWDAYGDLGVLLGRAIMDSPLGQAPRAPSQETIRATVIGAGSHSTALSGSTIHYQGVRFPLKNLPVVYLPPEQELQTLQRKRQWFAQGQQHQTVVALPGQKNPSFAQVCALAQALVPALQEEPIILVAVQEDMGKALGQAISRLAPGKPVVCLDGVRLQDGDYLDIGAPIMGVLPVVVKTLAVG